MAKKHNGSNKGSESAKMAHQTKHSTNQNKSENDKKLYKQQAGKPDI